MIAGLKHVHIVGVCGTLMGAFASFLKRSGTRVTGSDQNIYPPMSDVLKNAQIELFEGYSKENLDRLGGVPDLVVIGNVVTPQNVEGLSVRERGWKMMSLPEAMEELFLKNTTNLVVAGTHGKTTTSSLLAYTLSEMGLKPSYFFGGVAHGLKHSFQVEEGLKGYFVLEGDEYDTAFWDKVPKFFHYRPDHVILTSIEYDHADIYPDMAAVVRAFDGLIDRIRPDGHLIACIDYQDVEKVIKRSKVPVLTYGIKNPVAKFTLRELGNSTYDVLEGGKKIDQFSIKLPGLHNGLNALAAYIQCLQAGWDVHQFKGAMARFDGVKRRQEERGTIRGALVIDDFAHHPTAVRETLSALAKKYPGRRLLTVFEPRSATSRRKVFQTQYAEAFDHAAKIWIAKPYDQSKIAVADQFSSEQLIADINARKFSGNRDEARATLFSEIDAGVALVAQALREGDVVAVLSNGGFGGFISKLLAST